MKNLLEKPEVQNALQDHDIQKLLHTLRTDPDKAQKYGLKYFNSSDWWLSGCHSDPGFDSK